MPKVSFLMSNYNTPSEYLKKALDSVLSQTFDDFEVVIINDGSVDDSKTVLYDYAKRDKRIKIVENEQNLGLPRSLNKGIEYCSGEYIARMDTDDICYPDRLEKQVAYMDAHPKCIVSGAWADVFCEDENNIVKTWAPKMCSQDEYRIRLMFSSAPLIIHPTAIFRRELLNKNNLRYPEEIKYKYAEDYKMWTQCSACGEIGILEETVIKYRDENSDNRITVRHEKEMAQCGFEIQRDQLKQLDIEFTQEMYRYNHQLLMGRKPYDINYKHWMDLIIKQNAKHNAYSQSVLKKLFRERWYNIVYYGMAYEESFSQRIKYFNSLYFGQRTKFIISRITKKKPVKF